VAAVSVLLVPLAVLVAPPLTLALLVLAAFVCGAAITIGGVCEVALRQEITPNRLQGRMNATMRSLNWSTAAIGALIGGALGDCLGVVPALAIGATGSLLSSGWLVFSPIGRLQLRTESRDGSGSSSR
jgi:hypothetical protein